MSGFPRCLMIVTAEIDAAHEAAWNRWYDEVHLPAALACPGVLRGTRYRNARDARVTDHGDTSSDGRRIYTTVYELDSPGAMDTPEFQAMRGWYEFSDHIQATTRVFERL